MAKMEVFSVLFFFFFFFIFFFAEAHPCTNLQPHVMESFDVKYIQMKNEEICPYTVVINTSCDSSKFIRDQISISFGDAYGNQIFAPRLANPNPFEATFEQCSTNTFQINGSCAYQICYAYLKASGPDDWKPENVTINGPTTNSTSFNFSTIIPKDQWYGFNLCDDHHDDSSSHQVYTHTMFLYVLLLLGLLPICFWW